MPGRWWAIDEYSRAIVLDPAYVAPYNNRGAAAAQRDYAAAIRDYGEAIRLDPAYAAPYNNRGVAHLLQGDLQSALTDFDAVIERDPAYLAPRGNRARVQFYLGAYAASADDFAQVLRRAPADGYAMLWQAVAVSRSGGDGRAALERAVRAADLSQWPGPLIELWFGRRSFDQVVHLAPNGDDTIRQERLTETLFYRAQQLLAGGATAAARDLLRRVIDLGVSDFAEYLAAAADLAHLD